MKGVIQIKAGTYDLSDAMRLSIHASDDGAVITVCHRPTGANSIGVIDEHGTVVRRTANHQRASSSVPHDCFEESESRIEILSKVIKPAPKPKRKPKLIRFTLITTGRSSRRRNRPYVVAGFSNGDVTHVAYRISGEQVDRQLRLEGDQSLFGTQIPKADRLSSVEWAEVANMADNTDFQIRGRMNLWHKTPVEELRMLLGERTFHVAIKAVAVQSPSAPSITSTSPSSDRAKFKTRHVSILNCEPANFDHADGEPATAITISHKDSVEPVTIDLNDTRRLVVNLLISLWTADDSFAQSVLDNFPIKDGIHFWPQQE